MKNQRGIQKNNQAVENRINSSNEINNNRNKKRYNLRKINTVGNKIERRTEMRERRKNKIFKKIQVKRDS